MKYTRSMTRKALPKRNALVVALAVGMGISGLAFGQATTGAVFGSAPSGDTVQITSDSGINRSVTVGADGQYSFASLPLGTYTVTLSKNGSTVASRSNVSIKIGSGVAVNFASGQNATNLGTMQVSANALPTIDVTTVHDSTIITAQQLRQLPLGHNATSIALLTPGTVGSSAFGGVNFGGSSVAENAYYVNGYNTGAPYRNMSMFQLPYGAIGQQQTLAGGFGAKYGRSDGGVISQTGKSGTNQWHFGAQIRWSPRSIAATPHDQYQPVIALPSGQFCVPQYGSYPAATICDPSGAMEGYRHNSGTYHPGRQITASHDNGSWSTTYTGYVGGPLVKDKLFFFLDVAVTQGAGSSRAGLVGTPTQSFDSSHSTSYYGKINWNINDNNLFEFTYLGNQGKSGIGEQYNYDYATNQATTLRSVNNQNISNSKYLIAKYTSYIGDNATLSILWGHGTYHNPIQYANSSPYPYVAGGCNQNPAYWVNPGAACGAPGTIVTNNQNATSIIGANREATSHGLRVDFTYQLGNHKLGIGIDNMYYYATNQGNGETGGAPPAQVGPFPGLTPTGTIWIYKPADSNGIYHVQYYYYANNAGMKTKQKAYYLQDNWQVTPNLAAVIGLRNDQYVNYNNFGSAFVNVKNQWSPRIGLSWDVFGDSSLKIYGNIGRYYLALPLDAANRAADASFYLRQLFTYTGIDSNGLPTGLTAVTPVTSPDGETGGVKDPRQVTATNLKPMYTDQINVGFDAMLGKHWTYGAKLSYRQLGATIDDECSPSVIATKMASMGLNPGDYSDSLYGAAYCRLINPGRTSDMAILKNGTTSDYAIVPVSFKDWGYPHKPKREYAALNLYMQHNFDGKWFGRIDYTYTYGHGNTTGQLRPDIQQTDVSKTEDWDSAALMVGSMGELLSTRKHILRAYGSYSITPEWLVGANLMIQSGAPRECLGYFGPEGIGDPVNYNGHGSGNYHMCAGQVVHPGSDSPLAGHTPWLHQLDMNVTYTPAFADHRLSFKMIVYNVLNEQKGTQAQANFVDQEHVVDSYFHYPIGFEAPRSIDLVVSYDY
ncbi:MAG TPA: TonB-dependent receptor [Rhodanobacteraceae bacterium]